MRLVIDGHNMLGRMPRPDLSNAARDELLLRLQEYVQRHPTHEVMVFFDGRSVSRQRHGALRVRYSAAGRSADESMLDFLDTLSLKQLRETRIITSDGEVARAARQLGCRHEASEAFYQRELERTIEEGERRKSADVGLSARELSEWEEFFRKPRQLRDR